LLQARVFADRTHPPAKLRGRHHRGCGHGAWRWVAKTPHEARRELWTDTGYPALNYMERAGVKVLGDFRPMCILGDIYT